MRMLLIGSIVLALVAACSEQPDDSLKNWPLRATPAAPPLTVDSIDAGISFPDAAPPQPPAPPVPSGKTCGDCHKTIYGQWATSMHSRGLTSPVMVAQTNQFVRGPAAKETPETQRLCANCHSPTVAAKTTGATLPLTPSGAGDEGIGCTTCHQYNGDSASGSGALTSGYQAGLDKTGAMFGNLSTPAENKGHASATGKAFQQPGQLCQGCHDVNLDRNADKKIQKGVDLVLQTTAEEAAKALLAGDKRTCVSCHMPLLPTVTRAADSARIPEDQTAAAPDRAVHDHSFIGVDYPLDLDPAKDPQRVARQKLLETAASLKVEPATPTAPGRIAFSASITNVGATHNLPTGFAFTRQMWLEVLVLDKNGATVFSSGLLGTPLSDLCDNATLGETDNPMLPFLQGCITPDRQLVNFQAKLVDRVEVLRDAADQPILNVDGEFQAIQGSGAHETALQNLTGGAIARRRPVDNQALAPIVPGETRSFTYEFDANGIAAQPLTVKTRLLFRNLPPYFLRALAAKQPDNELPRLYPLIPNLQTVTMTTATTTVPAP